jgi:hypothetical protein
MLTMDETGFPGLGLGFFIFGIYVKHINFLQIVFKLSYELLHSKLSKLKTLPKLEYNRKARYKQ